jgi:hypothetical protein
MVRCYSPLGVSSALGLVVAHCVVCLCRCCTTSVPGLPWCLGGDCASLVTGSVAALQSTAVKYKSLAAQTYGHLSVWLTRCRVQLQSYCELCWAWQHVGSLLKGPCMTSYDPTNDSTCTWGTVYVDVLRLTNRQSLVSVAFGASRKMSAWHLVLCVGVL